MVIVVVLSAVTWSAQGCAAPAEDDLTQRIDAALVRAAVWTAAQQADDGGWHSATYGQMRGGAGNTALTVNALSRLPANLRTESHDAIERGLEFLLSNLDESGYVRAPDGSSDYPNYATALTLSAMARWNTDAAEGRLRNYLIAAQLTKQLPWLTDSDDVGGWSLVGGDTDDLASFRDVNLSATRLALEGLAAGGNELDPSLAKRAGEYVTRLQNADGGFRIVADPADPLNKAGVDAGEAARSYGTATADGLCALLLCGESTNSKRVKNAVAWLDERTENLSNVPGFTAAEDVATARNGLKYYYFAALARAMERLPEAKFARRGRALAERILSDQRADGSWANASSLMREDDPLIATAWSMEALSILRDCCEHPAAAP